MIAVDSTILISVRVTTLKPQTAPGRSLGFLRSESDKVYLVSCPGLSLAIFRGAG